MCLKKLPNLKNHKYKYVQKKFWKVVCYNLRYDKIESPIYNYRWKSGVNYCDRVVENAYIVDNSIHVFTSKKSAIEFMYNRTSVCVVIPVYADANDLIAYGKYNQAAFNKVFLKKEDYDEALVKGKSLYG